MKYIYLPKQACFGHIAVHLNYRLVTKSYLHPALYTLQLPVAFIIQ